MAGYKMNFNQDFTSICVLNNAGLRLFSINSTDKIEEIFAKDNENIRIAERLFNSSLVVLVTEDRPNCLNMLHMKKNQHISNYEYPSKILCVRMNRSRLIVCLAESIYIYDIREMNILQTIENIAPNELGLCSLSLNSHLAFPSCSHSGQVSIYNANKLQKGLIIKAHDSKLSALNFSPNGTLLATASERGTVIRVFCVQNGQRVHEFRRGVKRCVRIASLIFSTNGDFLCTSSNTETVHIFKIDGKAVEAAERKPSITSEQNTHNNNNNTTTQQTMPITTTQIATTTATTTETTTTAATTTANKSSLPTPSAVTSEQTNADDTTLPSNLNTGGWTGYLSYLPTQMCAVLTQDRAFATAFLSQPGLKHVCALARVQKELKVLIACEDGFLYIYEFNTERGGQCKQQRVHDLRSALDGVIELNLTDSFNKTTLTTSPVISTGAPINSSISMPTNTKTTAKQTPTSYKQSKDSESPGIGVALLKNPDNAIDKSYAGILKGTQGKCMLTDSVKYRKLCDAIDTPTKLYDERQFPPVAIAAKD